MSLLIGIHVQKTLAADADVVARVNNRIYPKAIPEGASAFPFIVYGMSGIDEAGTKDGNEDSIGVAIMCVAKTYEEAALTANAVRYALEGKRAAYNEYKFDVRDCMLNAVGDDYLEDLPAYAVTINMNFWTQDY